MRSTPNKSTHLSAKSFKEIVLTPAEKLWLTEVYKLGLGKIDFQTLRVRLRGELPRGFSYKTFQENYLLYGERISLLGIWLVDPQSEYVKATDTVLHCLRDILIEQSKSNSIGQPVSAHEISVRTEIKENVVRIALAFISDLGRFIGGGGGEANSFGYTSVYLSKSDESTDNLLNFENIECEMELFWRRAPVHSVKSRDSGRSPSFLNLSSGLWPEMGGQAVRQDAADNLLRGRPVWMEIRREFGCSKRQFQERIGFVVDPRTRKALLRDTEHAYALCRVGLSKPAIILAGGVIEELLRLYVQSRGLKAPAEKFEAYITLCEEKGLLKTGIGRLSDSMRHFRNLVHIEKEITEGQAISKAMGRSAMASLFTIISDFRHE